MTKEQMVETLQQMESKAWERLISHEYWNMPVCTEEEEDKWKETNRGFQKMLREWGVLNDVLSTCEIEKIVSEDAQELAYKIWERNYEYREQLKTNK